MKRRKQYQYIVYPIKGIKNISYDIEAEENKWKKELYITYIIENVQNSFIIPRIVLGHDYLLLLDHTRNYANMTCNRCFLFTITKDVNSEK